MSAAATVSDRIVVGRLALRQGAREIYGKLMAAGVDGRFLATDEKGAPGDEQTRMHITEAK